MHVTLSLHALLFSLINLSIKHYLFIYLLVCLFITIRYFFGMNIAETPPFSPLRPQGGSNDSTAAQGRRRMPRATQMVRFAVFKLRAA